VIFHSTCAPTLSIVVICACNDLCPGGECTTRDLTYEKNTYSKTAKVKSCALFVGSHDLVLSNIVFYSVAVCACTGGLFIKLKIAIIR